MTLTNKPKVVFWIIAVVAMIWNLMGVYQFLLSTVLKDRLVSISSAEELELFSNLPTWYFIAFGISVFSGVLGCIMLLTRGKLAVPLFLISLLGVLIGQGYWAFGTNVQDVMGVEAIVMPIIVVIISIFLYLYSKSCAKKGWLH